MKIILENWKKYINESDEIQYEPILLDAIKTGEVEHILQLTEMFKSLNLNVVVLKEPEYDRWDPNRFESFEKYWKRTGMSEPEEGVLKITNDQIETMLFLKNDIKDEELIQKYKEAMLYFIYDNGKRRYGINYDTIRYFNILFK